MGRTLLKHIRTAVWFGLVLGLAEASALAFRAFVLDGVMRATPQVVWMAPLAYAVLFSSIAIVLFAARLAVPERDSRNPLHTVLVFLSVFAILSLAGVLHPAASIVIALGAAVQARLLLRRHFDWFDRIVRASMLPIVAIVTMLGLVLNAGDWWSERAALRRWPVAGADAPNLIVIVWDTVRAASLGLYGPSAPTPHLDRLAARGVTFETALATTSWTLPSHASMFTGYLPNKLSATWFDPLDETRPTLAEAFLARGYRTGGFVANLLYTTREYGLSRGFAHYEDYRISPGQLLLSTKLGRLAFDTPIADWRPGPMQSLLGRAFVPGRKTASQVNADFLDWLDEDPDRPFFAFLNFFDAHRPYDAPSDGSSPDAMDWTLRERLTHLLSPLPADSVPPEEMQALLASYHAAITWLDEQLGILLEELETRGKLDNTIVVLTSDHGEEFEENGGMGHGTNLYFWQLRVPLVIVANGRVPAGLRVTQPVSLADLPATIARWLPGQPAAFPGTPLQVTWADGGSPNAMTAPVGELSPGRNRDRVMRSIATDGLYFIRNIDQSTELYDLTADPFQRIRLTANSDASDRLSRAIDERVGCRAGSCPDSGLALRPVR